MKRVRAPERLDLPAAASFKHVSPAGAGLGGGMQMFSADKTDDGAVGASTGLAAFLAVVEENLSGVSFDRERCTLWAVRNRPCGLYEVSLDGSTVRAFDLDATFYDGSELPGRSLEEIPHPLMTRTMDRLAEQARARPGRLRFIHLNHTNPALHDEDLRAEVEARGFAVAVMGERVAL